MLHGLKTTYKGKGKHHETAEGFNRINRRLNNMVGFNGIYIESVGDETRFFFRGDSDGASVGPRAFAIKSIDQGSGTVTFYGGLIIHGMNSIPIPESVVAIGGGTETNPSYAGVKYTYGATTAGFLPSTTTNIPLPTLSAWQQPIASFYRVAGKLYVKQVLWDSIIILPGILSPS